MSAPTEIPPRPSTLGRASTLELRGLSGLTEAQARTRLAEEGPNELPTEKKRGLFAIVLEVLREPMFLMLVRRGRALPRDGRAGRRRGVGRLGAHR